MAKILLVEDNKRLAELVYDSLSELYLQHDVDLVLNGADGLANIKAYTYDLLILDWDLPSVSGIEILKEFRSLRKNAPVIMITGKNEFPDKEKGFMAGADDYLTKPFDIKELVLRVSALLRRPQNLISAEPLSSGDIVLDRDKFAAYRNGTNLGLVRLEFALLEFLMRYPNQYFSPAALLERVWSNQSDATVESVKTCVKRLRKKIDEEGKPSLIENAYGIGYRFVVDDTSPAS
jgi:DNA-binding response OmpR family regulator